MPLIHVTSVDDLAEKILGLLDDTHSHMCGDIGHSLIPQPDLEKGCGYVFEHARPKTNDDETYRRAHMCPKCGRGPWTFRV